MGYRSEIGLLLIRLSSPPRPVKYNLYRSMPDSPMAAFPSQLETLLYRLMDAIRALINGILVPSQILRLVPSLVIGILTGAIAMAVLPAEAQTEASKVDSPLVAMAQNYLQLNDLNISCESMVTLELTPAYFQAHKPQNGAIEPRWQEHVLFASDKSGFYLEVSRLGAQHSVETFSYDGTGYAMYDGMRDIMIVYKARPTEPPQFWNLNSLVLPAGFFAKNQNRFNQIDCEWRDLINPSYWSSITGTAFSSEALPNGIGTSLKGIVNGKTISMTLSDKTYPFELADIENYPGPLALDPGFVGSRAGLKPLMDKPVLKYTLNEVGESTFTKNGVAANFFYPKKATLQIFDQFTGELVRTDTHEITRIIINDPNFDETKFHADPSRASRILDKDTGKWVTVPK